MPATTSDNTPVSKASVGAGTAKTETSASKPIYTCPMHPEVRQDYPGNCPKCGMTLELMASAGSTHDEENGELRDMTKRFLIGAALALPVFILAMAHLIPCLGRQSWVSYSTVAKRRLNLPAKLNRRSTKLIRGIAALRTHGGTISQVLETPILVGQSKCSTHCLRS